MLRFGTDGVRGLANVELTPELVMALGRAAARALGGAAARGPSAASSSAGTRAGRARSCRPPSRPGWRARASTWSTSGVLADAGGGLPLGRASGTGGGHLRIAQPLWGQRGQVFRRRRYQALRRGRGRPRSRARRCSWRRTNGREHPTGAGVGRISPDPGALARYERYVSELPGGQAPGRPAGGARLRQRRRVPQRSPGFRRRRRRRGERAGRRARRGQHQRRVRLDRPPPPGRDGGEPARRPGPGL